MRKTVTIVFTDLIGSTPLGERLDAETYRHVISRYFIEVSRVLEHHGGTVEKFIGDAVMAAFGIPILHEDDALRAVRAAAELREALGQLNVELQAQYGFELGMRTGINTGEVVAGDPAEGHAFATGEQIRRISDSSDSTQFRQPLREQRKAFLCLPERNQRPSAICQCPTQIIRKTVLGR